MRERLFLGNAANSATIVAARVIAVSFLIVVSLSFTFPSVQLAYGHHVIEQIEVANRPLRMSIAGDMLYIANIGAPSVSVINTTTDQTVQTINTTGGVSALYAAPEVGKLYVSIFEAGRVEVYDLETYDLIKNIPLPGATVDLWFSPLDNTQEHVTFLTGGVSMDFDPTTGMLYVAVYSHDHIEVIDTATDTAIKTIDVPAHPYTVKVDPEAKMLLVASLAGNRLSFISTDTNEVIGSMNTGTGPWGLDIDTSTHTAYVTHRGVPYVAAVDIATRQVIAKIPVTDDAQAIAVDPSERKVYFSFLDKQDIVKVNGETNEVETVIEMDAVPWDLVADPLTHRVYASTKFGDYVIAIGPESISTSFPVVTLSNPAAVLGIMRAHAQDVVVSEPVMDIPTRTLSMGVSTEDGGELTLELPRYMIDSGQQNASIPFQVTVDGNPVEYQEGELITSSEDGSQSRQITVFIPAGSTRLDVIGTQVLPNLERP
jgi:YVTN family beta-propeller protein